MFEIVILLNTYIFSKCFSKIYMLVFMLIRLVKDIVRSVKKRLLQKNPKIHLLTLTVLFHEINLLIAHVFSRVELNYLFHYYQHSYYLAPLDLFLKFRIFWNLDLYFTFLFQLFIYVFMMFYVFLQLLETMVKNCGDYVHFQIADRNVLQEMVKIVKKKV